MSKTQKPHHSLNAYERHILLLTAVLRLRVSPPVPYLLIACIIVAALPKLAQTLADQVATEATQATFGESGMEDWLAEYLEEKCDFAGNWAPDWWVEALHLERRRAEEMLSVTGLDACGYLVIREEEMEVQRGWWRKGDWRAGSEPLGRLTKADEGLRWIGKETLRESRRRERPKMVAERDMKSQAVVEYSSNTELVSRLRGHTVTAKEWRILKEEAPVEGESTTKEPKIHPCFKPFSEQLEAIQMLQG